MMPKEHSNISLPKRLDLDNIAGATGLFVTHAKDRMILEGQSIDIMAAATLAIPTYRSSCNKMATKTASPPKTVHTARQVTGMSEFPSAAGSVSLSRYR